jgi:TPP-dependent 2-oxoacid decarboxylase
MEISEFSGFTFRHFPAVAEHDRIELVQAAFHHLHADPNVTFAKQCTVKVHREYAIAWSHRNVEIHEQTSLLIDNCVMIHWLTQKKLSYLFLCVDCRRNSLNCHHSSRLNVPHFFNDTVSTTTQIRDLLEIIRLHFEGLVIYRDCRASVEISWWRQRLKRRKRSVSNGNFR